MVHDTPRQRRHAETFRRMLHAARGCVALHGIDGLTLAAVARELDLTTPALYRYVPSKGALLAHLNAQVLQGQRQRVRRVMSLAGLPGAGQPLLALLAVVELIIALAEREPSDFGLVSVTLADPRALVPEPEHAVHLPVLVGLLAELQGLVDACVDRGIAEGDAEARVVSLVFGTLSTLQLGKLRRFRADLDPARFARSGAEDLLVGWGADRRVVADLWSAARRLAHQAIEEDP